MRNLVFVPFKRDNKQLFEQQSEVWYWAIWILTYDITLKKPYKGKAVEIRGLKPLIGLVSPGTEP
jgi:hypothetical protein